MARINLKRKTTWKKIGTIVLSVVLALGSVVGVTALIQKIEEDTLKTVTPTYSVGGLNTSGAWQETDSSIYTKNAFECQGLKITPSFDSTISYQVFFYDSNDTFMYSTQELTSKFENAPLSAKYARVLIIPKNDDKVAWYETLKYSTQLKIEVNKSQVVDVKSLIKGQDNKFKGLGTGNIGSNGFTSGGSNFYCFDKIDVRGKSTLIFKIKTSSLKENIEIIDSTETVVYSIPCLYGDYEGDTESKYLEYTSTYNTLNIVGEYSYISFDVTSFDSVMGYVNFSAYQNLEIYVL